MKPERWQQVEQLYHAALEREPEERAAFLNKACDGDGALRQEVESLLAYDEPAQRFIATPPDALAAELLAADQAPSLIGSSLNHYQILSRLGRGGMGEVYLATDTRLGRKVAIKLLPEEFTRDAERMRRFEQEARAASALNHPNIITIHEISQVDQRHFIVSEFVEGDTLRQRLKSGSLELETALEVATQVASALAAAHAAGIVHRDIKPENVMLRPDGLAKVLDFGLAKLIESPTTTLEVDAQTETPVRLSTEPGVVMGTLNYMSPEQARGLKVDQRTDIFSLGVMLYEMITSQTPFGGATPTDVIVAILEREPLPLTRYSGEAPVELERIVMKALRKERENRYPTVKDMSQDLKNLKQRLQFEAELARARRAEAGDGISVKAASVPTTLADTRQITARTGSVGATRTTSRSKRLVSEIKRHKTRVALALATLVVVIAGLSFGMYQWISQDRSGNKSAEPFQKMKITKLTTPGKAKEAAISPDGKYVVYAFDEAGQQSLWIRQVAIAGGVQIVPPAEVRYQKLAFSPSGDFIYFIQAAKEKGALYQVPTLGGAVGRLIADVSFSFSLSPDGQQVAFIREDESRESALILASTRGSGEKRLVTRRPASLWLVAGPAWSLDGKLIAFADSGAPDSFYATVRVVELESETEKSVAPQKWWSIDRMTWLADGSGLIMTAQDKRSSPFQVWHLSYPGGEVRRITNDLDSYFGLSLTADSRSLVMVQTNEAPPGWNVPDDREGGAKRKVYKADWTREGKQLALTRRVSGDVVLISNLR
jgi:serine/threonine protein kinase